MRLGVHGLRGVGSHPPLHPSALLLDDEGSVRVPSLAGSRRGSGATDVGSVSGSIHGASGDGGVGQHMTSAPGLGLQDVRE